MSSAESALLCKWCMRVVHEGSAREYVSGARDYVSGAREFVSGAQEKL